MRMKSYAKSCMASRSVFNSVVPIACHPDHVHGKNGPFLSYALRQPRVDSFVSCRTMMLGESRITMTTLRTGTESGYSHFPPPPRKACVSCTPY